MTELLLIILGTGLLIIWFSITRITWIEKHFTNPFIVIQILPDSLMEYFFKRYLPIILVTFFICYVNKKIGNPNTLIFASIGFIHASLLALWYGYRNIFRSKIIKYPFFIISFYGGIILVSSLFSLVGLILENSTFLLAQSIQEIVYTILFAGIILWIAYYFIFSKYNSHSRIEKKIGKSFYSLRPFYKKIITTAKKQRINPYVFISIAVLENMTRPYWVRTIEYVIHRLGIFPIRTFGIMQVSSKIPLTDEESIEESALLIKQINKKLKKERNERRIIELGKIYQGTKENGELLLIIYKQIYKNNLLLEHFS